MDEFTQLLEQAFHENEVIVSRRGLTVQVADNDHVIYVDYKSPTALLVYEIDRDRRKGRHPLLKWCYSESEAVSIIKKHLHLA